MSSIVLKNAEEIELMRESALIVSKTLGMLAGEIKPGISTLELDALAETCIRDHGAIPGFLGLYDFPNTLCMSPNAQVVHGIPNKEPLQVNYILRGMNIKKGKHTIEFNFDPPVVHTGGLIQCASLAVFLILIGFGFRNQYKNSNF